MLNIIFGRENYKGDKFVINSHRFFLAAHKHEWFQDPLIVRAIREVDRSEVVIGEALINRFGQGYSVETLSGGTQCLCCIKFFPDRCFNLSQMGDNVLPFVYEIARERDVTCVLEHPAKFSDEVLAEGLICIDGVIPKDFEEYSDMYYDALKKHEKYMEEVIDPLIEAEERASRNS